MSWQDGNREAFKPFIAAAKGATRKKGEKHILAGGPLAHAFAHQNVTWGKRTDGLMYFEPDAEDVAGSSAKRVSTIYSYGSHFPLASLYHPKKGAPIVLLTSKDYSVSTGQHKKYVEYATKHLTRFFVSKPRYPASAKEEFQATITGHVEHVRNPRSRLTKWAIEAAEMETADANAFAKAFGFRWRLKLPIFTEAERLRAAELEDIRNARDKVKWARQEARQEANRVRNRERAIEALQAWRNNPGEIEMPWNVNGYGIVTDADNALAAQRQADKVQIWRDHGGRGWDLPGTLLRWEGDTIYTSKGAEFPASHGARAWPVVKKCHDTHTGWETNGHKVHLGHYQIDRITEDGDVRAGCHNVPYAEILRIAEAMGLPT